MNRVAALRMVRIGFTWLLTLFLARIFVVQGVAKFSATSGWGRAFQHWGYPDWFRNGVGVAEVAAAALLLVPLTAPLGAIAIILVMLGGIATHVTAGDRQTFQSEMLPIIFASVILALRWRSVARLSALARRSDS